jgi:hypothetical protein
VRIQKRKIMKTKKKLGFRRLAENRPAQRDSKMYKWGVCQTSPTSLTSLTNPQGTPAQRHSKISKSSENTPVERHSKMSKSFENTPAQRDSKFSKWILPRYQCGSVAGPASSVLQLCASACILYTQRCCRSASALVKILN